MKLTIGYTAYHEVEMEAPPEIEEAYHKYQKMWADYEADPLNAPYPCDYAEEDKIREDANWVNDTLYSRYYHNELYEKMLTEKGREEVEYFLQCAARDYAGESFEGDYFATTLDV